MTTLLLLLAIPVVGALLTGLGGRVNGATARGVALVTMILDFVVAVVLMFQVAHGPVTVQYDWIRSFGVSFFLEADGLSAVMIQLTALIGILAVIISWKEIHEKVGAFHVWILLLQTGVLLVFLARDAMLFYFGWELMLVPMFFLIGVWGHEDKLYSAIKFFLFTFVGSIFMLLALLYVYFQHSKLHGAFTFNLNELIRTGTQMSYTEQWWVFLGLFIGFAVKVPLFPMHTWLPDAHTQAPTAGSLILAGLLLKTGVYGMIRIAIPLAPDGAEAFQPIIIALSVFGIFYGAIAAFVQRDFKRLVAYSSISHLGFVVLGLFVGNENGVVGSATGFQGCVLQMVNHGLATGALFLIAGMLQERAHTRDFGSFGGLWRQMPVMGGFLLFFALTSLGIPGTGNFIGELYVIGATFAYNWWLGGITALGVLFAAAYSLRVFLATMHGRESAIFKNLPDTSARENFSLTTLAILLILIGFYPSAVTQPLFYTPDETVPAAGRNIAPAATGEGRAVAPTPHHATVPKKSMNIMNIIDADLAYAPAAEAGVAQ